MASSKARRRPAGSRPRRLGEGNAEPLQVVGGRFWLAVGCATVMAFTGCDWLGAQIQDWSTPAQTLNKSNWQVGNTAEVSLTLITADYDKLMCASEQSFEGKHCAYQSETQIWPRDPEGPIEDNKADIIQPYRTAIGNQLILVAGLWADPAIAMRLHREPFRGVPERKLSRFVANCKMKFIGEFEPKLRWGPRGQWMSEGKAMVAQPISCKLAPYR